MESVRTVLEFPKESTDKPVIYRLVKDYELVINILKARITPTEEGRMVIEITGDREKIKMGLDFLSKQGVSVKSLSGKITLTKEECVHCGVCVGVCFAGALRLDEAQMIKLTPEKCTLCELCLKACPLGIIKVEF